MFAFYIAHARTFVGFGLGEFIVVISDSVITFIVVVKFVSCNIFTALETQNSFVI